MRFSRLSGPVVQGEVYRAWDTKLGREVANKVLPEVVSQNKERLARLEREARVLASLNHPNIATLYGLEQSEGTQYLVVELVPGETLGERIAKGPIPVEVSVTPSIASTLEGSTCLISLFEGRCLPGAARAKIHLAGS
jgi:serine/threonine-protein kinase